MGILGQITNDTTVEQDKNPIEGTGTEATIINGQDPKSDKKVIVMDGPLSTIYTKALNLAFSNEREEVSVETQQMDAVMVADAHKWMKTKEKMKQENMDKAAYVYVTNHDTAIAHPADTFDDLRIALNMETNAEKIICIECLDPAKVEGGFLPTLITYVENHPAKPKVFFNRKSLIEHLGR